MKNKTRDYKYFNYPNQLTALEQYYYYLLEFGAIPQELPPLLIETIFKAMAKDYVDGFIAIETFESLAQLLCVNFVNKQINIDRQAERLIDLSSDVTYYGEKEIQKLTEELREWLLS